MGNITGNHREIVGKCPHILYSKYMNGKDQGMLER